MNEEYSKLFDRLTVSLRDYFELKIASIETATALARNNLEKRLEGMNEFREALRDQSSKMLTRTEHELYVAKTDGDIRFLRENLATIQGKASYRSVIFSYIISIIALLFELARLIK